MNIYAVQNAIYDRLANFTALSSVVASIGYEKPQDEQSEDLANFPYTVIEDISAIPWDTKLSDGGNQLIQVTTFCRPTASKSAVTLANETAQSSYDALHKYDLVIASSNTVELRFEESPGNLPDPDGITRYRPMTFRLIYSGAT